MRAFFSMQSVTLRILVPAVSFTDRIWFLELTMDAWVPALLFYEHVDGDQRWPTLG